jgi:hypothetical protein
LALFLEGSQLIGKKRLGLPKLCQEDLAIRGSSGNRVGEDILVGCEIESYTAGY